MGELFMHGFDGEGLGLLVLGIFFVKIWRCGIRFKDNVWMSLDVFCFIVIFVLVTYFPSEC
ncbi:hypothetical protein Sjap_016268 [Stephania japonica]|uniref:Transmembrane protein n=1 Tax=Stephania japonica TaxID=461633 RepID=A0AAP0IKQ3_9MAGN